MLKNKEPCQVSCKPKQTCNPPPNQPTIPFLVLQQSQGTLDYDILQDGSWRNINGAAFCGDDNDGAFESDTPTEVDSSSNGQMIKLDDLGDAADTLLEVRDLLEVVAELDERSWAEAVGVNLELAVLQ